MRFPYSDMPNAYVHPTQLYSVASSLVIFAILIRIRGRFPRAGHLFLSYLILYSISRFFMEITRAGATGRYLVAGFWMTDGQLASIGIIIIAAIVMGLTWRQRPEAASPQTPARAERKHVSGKRH